MFLTASPGFASIRGNMLVGCGVKHNLGTVLTQQLLHAAAISHVGHIHLQVHVRREVLQFALQERTARFHCDRQPPGDAARTASSCRQISDPMLPAEPVTISTRPSIQ